MDWFKLIKNTYFLKDDSGDEIYGKNLLDFLTKKEQLFVIGTDEEKWAKLFDLIDEWSKLYLTEVRRFSLDGIVGWFLNITFTRFMYSDEINMDITEYLYIISLICWRNSHVEYFHHWDKNFYMKRAWETDFYYFFCYESFSFQNLSKADFLGELNYRYMCAYKRFGYYIKTFAKLTLPPYPEYYKYIRQLDNAIGKDDIIIRINSFGNCEEPYWYFIISDSLIYLINIEDFM